MNSSYDLKSDRFMELRSINLSISTLSKVISQLSENVFLFPIYITTFILE